MAQDETRGAVPPYGQAIWDAAKRGDLSEMEQIADAARVTLAQSGPHEGVQFAESAEEGAERFAEVPQEVVTEVRLALSELEKRIAELRARPGAQRTQPQAGGEQSDEPEPDEGSYRTTT